MAGRKDDPDLAPDASLALEIEDPEARRLEQLAYFGGEDDDDIDAYDATGEDDGSVIGDNPAPAASQGDEETKDEESEEDDSDGEDSDDAADDADDADDDDASDDGDEDDTQDGDDDTQDGDDEEEEEEPAGKAPKGIPKHRFDEVNERRKAAEAELAALKAREKAEAQAEESKYDFRANEKEYMDLLLDGDTEAALAKREEIDAAKEAKWRSDAKTETKTELSTDAETQELIALSTQAEQMFDVFNPDHEDYDQGLLNKVLVFMRGYETEMSRTDAFVAGLADVVQMYNLMPDETPADDGQPKPTGKKKVDKKKAAIAKKAVRPVGGDTGEGSAHVGAAVPDIDNMTDEELDALPEKTLARLRGDFV